MLKFYNPFEKIEPVIKALAELDTPLRPGWILSICGLLPAIYPSERSEQFEPYILNHKPSMDELVAIAKGYMDGDGVPEYGEYLWFNIPEEWLNKFGLTRKDSPKDPPQDPPQT